MFIVIEGIDGTGKTTVSKILHNKINNSILTKTPNNSQIRDILFSNNDLPNQADYHLFMADMYDVDYNIVRPNLSDGNTVICDRWYYSTHIYQLGELRENTDFTEPDILVVLDIPIKIAMERIKGLDKYEKSDLTKWEDRRANYLSIKDADIILDVRDRTPEDIVETILSLEVSNAQS
ncbi:MAG: dTMP kinase [Petrotogales bacterium]